MTGAAVAVRGTVLLAGLALVLLPPPHSYVLTGLSVVGVLAAVAAPEVVGSGPASIAFVIDWLTATGWHDQPGLARTIAAGVALYVLHVSTSLAACLPVGVRVGAGVVRAWVSHCALPVAAAALIVAIDLALPRRSGTALAELAGLVGVVAVAAAVAAAVRHRRPVLDKMAGRATESTGRT